MKRLFFLLALAATLPLQSMAQDDDLYFNASKAAKTAKQHSSVDEQPAYYCGSDRDVDEYNRRGKFRSYYQKIGSDSLGNDIITFQPGKGVYPDSSYVDTMYVYPGSVQFDDDDYTYSRRMNRWDGFYGHYYDPWYYNPWYHDPWYYSWYGPRYGCWGYAPWYWGYGGWYDPWY